jgi:serine/threonine-protein kinase RsbW
VPCRSGVGAAESPWPAAEDEVGVQLSANVSLPGRPASVVCARQVLDALLNLTDASDERRGHLAVLVTEACANAVVHATADSQVELSIDVDLERCVIEVGNRGEFSHRADVIADPPGPLAMSGRGLPLIAALADSATFVTTRPGQVLLRITKHLTD